MADDTRRNIYLTVAATMLLGFASVGLFVNKLTNPRVMSDGELKINGAYVFDKPRIIEAFELQDQDGQPFRPEDLRDRWSLIFFGYTYCPDICPTTMADLRRFWSFLDEDQRRQTQIILVSVDPARDTPERLAQYVRYFDPAFLGVTGDFMALQGFARNVNAAFTKVAGARADEYLVDHTANIVLINPRGDYHGFFKPATGEVEGMFDPGKLNLTYQSIVESFGH